MSCCAQVLDFLQSSGLVAPPVDLRVDAAGVDPPPPPLGSPEALATMGGGAAGGSPGGRPGSTLAGAKRPTTPSNGKPGAAAGAGAAEAPPVKLATDVEAVIDACKKETEAVAKTYYAAKVRAACA